MTTPKTMADTTPRQEVASSLAGVVPANLPSDPFEIPGFLQRTETDEERKARLTRNRRSAKEPRLRKEPGSNVKFGLPQNIEPAGLAILKEQEKAKQKKKTERLAALKTRSNDVPKPGPKEEKLRAQRAQPKKERKAATKAHRSKKASAPAKPKAEASVPVGGTKLQMVVDLLKRPEGCTTADALAATGWPAISFNQQAKAAKIKLRKEKEGRITRYFAA